MTQQRCEYIAEKILCAKKRIQYGKTWLYVPDKEFEPPFEWEFSKGETFNSRTDFESLPEWVGPICEVMFPLLAKKNWSISFLYNGHVSLRDSEGWAVLDIRTGPLATVLIDAHIKISGE
ncbi:hypothetical protein [Leptospira interrogans]|uniref:hypothetical protein n=1 Tax=Leptospira interrogans TaxID=173 RepID=UPI000774DD4A|nr:hypothetical protein [Leptospira interrogans]WOT12214.1 hypothetical protein CFY92_0007085 [Leptospira interrogans]